MELTITRPTAPECKECEVPEKARASCLKIFKKREDITEITVEADCLKNLIIKCRVLIKKTDA
ncbi:MAG: hypothetical protein LBH03_05915 [Holophagales bacterium]|jgi:hypothetical protein|nr:hypothetical protein [Holophagales bacterium]